MNNPIILIEDDIDFLETLKLRLANFGFKKVRTEKDSLKVASLFEKGNVFDIAMRKLKEYERNPRIKWSNNVSGSSAGDLGFACLF